MQAGEMLAVMRKRPFEPFRLHLTDGRVIDIKYPHLNLVTELRLVVGVPDPNDLEPTIADHFAWVEWFQIAKMEPLQSATSA